MKERVFSSASERKGASWLWRVYSTSPGVWGGQSDCRCRMTTSASILPMQDSGSQRAQGETMGMKTNRVPFSFHLSPTTMKLLYQQKTVLMVLAQKRKLLNFQEPEVMPASWTSKEGPNSDPQETYKGLKGIASPSMGTFTTTRHRSSPQLMGQ